MIARIRLRISYLRWLWRQRGLWFQRARPVFEAPIQIAEGKRGEGKSRWIAWKAIPYLRRDTIGGRRVTVAANFRLRDPLTGRRAVEIKSWVDAFGLAVRALERGEILILCVDELHEWAGARDFRKTAGWWRWLMSQSRKFGIGFFGATQSLKDVEIFLRRRTDRLIRIRRVDLWRAPLFRLEDVDPESVDSDEDYRVIGGELKWFRAHAYLGSATQEFVSSVETREEKGEDRKIAELQRRARAVSREICSLPALPDESPGAAPCSSTDPSVSSA